MSSKRIALNVGGQRFETYVATFTKYPNSLLGRMFSPDNAEMVRPDEKNEYFIDRNGKYFEPILDFYRTGLLIAPTGVLLRIFKEEVQYYQLPEDCEILESDQSWGKRVLDTSFQVAYENVKAQVDRIVQCVESAVSDAANHGCYQCKIDIMSRDAFLRTARGLIKEAGHDPDVTLATRRWHSNLIDEAVTNFLQSDVNRLFVVAHLKREGLEFSLKPERSFFVLKVHIFRLKEPKQRY